MLETRKDLSFALEEGMLYPLLYRLCDDGHVSSYEKETAAGPRRFYKLTRAGVHLAAPSQRRMPSALPLVWRLGGR